MAAGLDRLRSNWSAPVGALLFLLALSSPCNADTPNGSSKDQESFKLQASVSALGKFGIQDAPWRYFSEQGARAYASRDYQSAEKYYTASLQDAEKRHIDDRNLVLIATNLASTMREEGDFGGAEQLFKGALSLSEKKGSGPQSAYNYALRQYAALLRKTGRNEEAQFAYEAARNGQYLLSGSAHSNPPLDGQASRLEEQRPQWERGASAEDEQAPADLNRNIAAGTPDGSGHGGQSPERNLFIWNVVGVGLNPGGQPSVETLDKGSTYFTGSPNPLIKQVLNRLLPQQ